MISVVAGIGTVAVATVASFQTVAPVPLVEVVHTAVAAEVAVGDTAVVFVGGSAADGAAVVDAAANVVDVPPAVVHDFAVHVLDTVADGAGDADDAVVAAVVAAVLVDAVVNAAGAGAVVADDSACVDVAAILVDAAVIVADLAAPIVAVPAALVLFGAVSHLHCHSQFSPSTTLRPVPVRLDCCSSLLNPSTYTERSSSAVASDVQVCWREERERKNGAEEDALRLL